MSRESEIDKIASLIEKYCKHELSNYEIRTTHGDIEKREFHTRSVLKTGLLAKALIDSGIGTRDRFYVDYDVVLGEEDKRGLTPAEVETYIKPIDYKEVE